MALSSNNEVFKTAFLAWVTLTECNKRELRNYATMTYGKTPGWYDSRERGQTEATQGDIDFLLMCIESDQAARKNNQPEQFHCTDCEGIAPGVPALVLRPKTDRDPGLYLCSDCVVGADPNWEPFPDYSIRVEKMLKEAEITHGSTKTPPEGLTRRIVAQNRLPANRRAQL
jgi:hypothetical protein